MPKINYKSYGDVRGYLMPIEFATLPFIPKRSFVVHSVTKNEVRGEHAHIKTEQLLVCVKGEIEVTILNSKWIEEKTILKEGDTFYLGRVVWGKQKFLTGNEIMLVFASTEYNIDDYINDLEKFKNNENNICGDSI
jgi:dTDP-4-dehydrorhamnose 3,5-epimerase-like enzyme